MAQPPKPIIWEDYIYDESIKPATEENMEAVERGIGRKIPEPLRQMMIEHGGQSPTNLFPRYNSGNLMAPDCLFHVNPELDDDDDTAYTPGFGIAVLEELEFYGFVPFALASDVYLCLDYRQSDTEPSVVIIDRECEPESPDAYHPQADSIMEFFERYVV